MKNKLLLMLLFGILAVSLVSFASAYSFSSQPGSEGKDAYINSASVTRNYGADNVIKMTTTDAMRSLIEFNLSSIPYNAVISNAYIELYLSSKGVGASVPVTIQRLTSSWTEGTGIDQVTGDGATWNNRTGSATWTTVGGDFDSQTWANITVSTQDIFYDWNITSLVQNWVNGTYSNNGAILRTLSGNGNWQFASGDNTNATIRPKIVVNYTIPLNVTFVSPTPNNASTVNGSSVYVNVSLTNGNASSAKLEWTNGGSTNYTMSNNTKSNWYYNVTNLTSTTYTYKVYVNDSSDGTVYASDLRTIIVNADTTSPSITWSSPTPNDGETINQNSVYLNTTITDASETSAFFDWNYSLVGYWAMDFYNSTGIYDNSTYGNFGNFSGGLGTANITTGRFGSSLIFDGVNDAINCGNNSRLNGNGAITVEAWVKTSANYEDIIYKWQSSGNQRTWGLYITSTGLPRFVVSSAGTSTSATITGTTNVSNSNWHLISAVYNSTNLRLFVDGAENTAAVSYSSGLFNSNASVKMAEANLGSNYFSGQMDEIKIFNRALSSEEILASYNNTANRLYHNFTGLSDGAYTYSAYTIDSAGNLGKTTARTVTISSCSANMTNTTWSSWANLICSGTQMNQSRYKTEYDSNNCGATNTTYYEYQLVGPTYANTSWSEWTNISCLSNDKMNQSRSLTQYDTYACAANSTITEYRQTETCDYCTPNLANTTWGSWYNITACLPGDYYTQERNATQYDSNNCGEIANSTVYGYQNLSCTYNKIPVVTTPSITPATAYTQNDLTCSFTVTDEDADSLSVNYTWYNGTSAVVTGSMSVTNGTESSIILGNGNTTKNEVWNCSIKPYDTKDYGTEKSAARTISNSLPTAPGVNVLPDVPSNDENLVATIATASTDLDNDSIAYSYQWYKNDVLQVGQTANTLSNILTSVGENWKCIVTPNDGTANGATGQDNVTIVSSDTTAPTITIVNPVNGTSLSVGTTETWINITTNENASCKYNTTSSAFSFNEGTNFTTTGNSAHSFLFSGMSGGQNYTFYYKCNDTSGNINSASTMHSFSVSVAPYCGDGTCNNGETCSTCSADCGTCPTPPSGGGSHGGGKIVKNNTIQNNTNISQPASPSQQLVGCSENWQCGNWTDCSTEGLQVRACNDANSCRTTISKPAEIQACTKPTCSDGIQNQEELGIDCGGPCPRRCGIGELSGKVVEVPSPEKTAKSKYGFLLIGLLFVLVGMLTMISRVEYRIKGHIRKSHILTHLHEHHHGTPVNPEASHIKDIGNARLKLLLMNIAHIIIIIVIIGVIYYLVR